jgi:acetoacetate decarboxylase
MRGRFNVVDSFSMPPHAPLYLRPPAHYMNVSAIVGVAYGDPGGVSDVVPSDLELATLGGDKPLVVIFHAHYPFSSLYGSYSEVIIAPVVLHEDRPHLYVAYIYVDNDSALTAGREIWGFPKKLAHMELRLVGEYVEATLERPRGTRLITTQVMLERRAKLSELDQLGLGNAPTLLLKVIPSPDAESKPMIQLVGVETRITPRVGADGEPELWSGRFMVELGRSMADPLYRLGPLEPITAYYGRFDMTLPPGRVIKAY